MIYDGPEQFLMAQRTEVSKINEAGWECRGQPRDILGEEQFFHRRCAWVCSVAIPQVLAYVSLARVAVGSSEWKLCSCLEV